MEPRHSLTRLPDYEPVIPVQTYKYNNLTYTVGVTDKNDIRWRVWADMGDQLALASSLIETDVIQAHLAVQKAHDAARSYIDNYVRTHRELQEAMEESARLRGHEDTTPTVVPETEGE